jgi:hypothetical protein
MTRQLQAYRINEEAYYYGTSMLLRECIEMDNLKEFFFIPDDTRNDRLFNFERTQKSQ